MLPSVPRLSIVDQAFAENVIGLRHCSNSTAVAAAAAASADTPRLPQHVQLERQWEENNEIVEGSVILECDSELLHTIGFGGCPACHARGVGVCRGLRWAAATLVRHSLSLWLGREPELRAMSPAWNPF